MSATNRGSERVPNDSYPTPRWAVRRFLEAATATLPRGTWLEPCAGAGVIVEEIDGYADKLIAIEIDPSFQKQLGLVLKRAGSKAGPMIGDYLQIPSKVDVIITNPPFSLGFEVAKKAVTEARHVALLLRLNFLGSGTKSGRSDWLRANPPDVYVLPNRPSFAASVRCVSKFMLGGAHAPESALPEEARAHVGSTCPWRVVLPVEAERPRMCPWCAGRVSCSTTDATEYAWFVWHTYQEADPRQLALIPAVPRRHGKIQILADTPPSERGSDD